MSDSSIPFSTGEQVTAFINSSGMSKVDLELLMGLSPSSKGKTLRRWELYGAPPSAAMLMTYMDRFGLVFAWETIGGGPSSLSVGE